MAFDVYVRKKKIQINNLFIELVKEYVQGIFSLWFFFHLDSVLSSHLSFYDL